MDIAWKPGYSLNAEFEYGVVKAKNEYYVIAEELIEDVMKAAEIEEYEVVGKFKGEDLEGILCKHPFLDRDSVIITGDHVTLEAGTGCVHTAPGHGAEDFEVCKKYDIPVIVPVDDKGHLTADAGQFAGLYYEKSNAAIIEQLKQTGHLWLQKNRTPIPTLLEM